MKTINEMTLDELYTLKGKLSTDLDIIQNDLKQINQKIMEVRQQQFQSRQADNVLDIKKKQ